MQHKEDLNRAIALAGGLSAFTEKVGAPSVHAVKAWRQAGVPERYCPTIERITGGAVRCEELRPDVEWGVLRQSTASATEAEEATHA